MQRLKTRSQFQAVLAGSTLARTSHFVLHGAELDASMPNLDSSPPLVAPLPGHFPVRDAWMGAMVPKRWAKRAVTRNAIRRQIYGVSADYASILPAAAHVVRLRAGFDGSRFVSATSDLLKVAVRQELQQLFEMAAASFSPVVRRDGAA